MKIIIDTGKDSVLCTSLADNRIKKLANLVQEVLEKQDVINKNIKARKNAWPDDEWVSCNTLDLHFSLESDGSRRTRRLLYAYSLVKQGKLTNTDTSCCVRIK